MPEVEFGCGAGTDVLQVVRERVDEVSDGEPVVGVDLYRGA